MFDGLTVKMIRSTEAGEMFRNQTLGFTKSVDSMTGEERLSNGQRSKYRGIELRGFLRENQQWAVEVSGSIHKFYHRGRHNYDDFTPEMILSALSELADEFGINPWVERINSLEWGVNIVLPFKVKKVLDSLISFRGYPFNMFRDRGFDYYQVEPDGKEFVLKIYDKGREFNLNSNVLRIEIKALKMAFIREGNDGVPIDRLSDILITDYWPILANRLLRLYDEIIFNDLALDCSVLSSKRRDLIHKGRAPSYWKHRRRAEFKSSGEYEAHRKKRVREEVKFRALCMTDWQKKLRSLMVEKLQTLTLVTPEFLSQNYRVLRRWKSAVFLSQNYRLSGGWDKPVLSQNYPLYIGAFWDNLPFHEPMKMQGVFCLPNKAKEQGIRLQTARYFDGLGLSQNELLPTNAAGSKSLPYGLELSPAGKYGITTKLLRDIAGKCPDCVDGYDTRKEKRKRKRDHIDETELIAHALRNAASNGRNNARKSWERKRAKCGGAFLFSEEELVSPDKRALLSEFRGTQWDCGF